MLVTGNKVKELESLFSSCYMLSVGTDSGNFAHVISFNHVFTHVLVNKAQHVSLYGPRDHVLVVWCNEVAVIEKHSEVACMKKVFF